MFLSAETLFNIFNTAVLLPWLLMLFAPRWKYTQWAIGRLVFPVFLGIGYCLIVPQLAQAEGAGFTSLEGIKNLFVSDYVLVAGWIHYLAFDLFVGSWILLHSQRAGLPHWMAVFPMLGCFMLGPFGLLLYLLLHYLRKKSVASVDQIWQG